jgi:gluconate 2-dehydrogenase alpha chain
MKTLPSTDVVIIGGGWTGLLMAKELGYRTPLSVVVLERGQPRGIRDYIQGMDELDFFVRKRLMQDPSRETVTLRHSHGGRALPLRQFGSFLPGSGIGGTGEHWGALVPRLMPDCFELYSKTVDRYGAKRLPEDHSVQDWGVSYDELESYYLRAERLMGASGKAGNLNGKKVDGGNVFEGWRSADYPNPPTTTPYFSTLFGEAAKSLGYHPYPNPSAVNSKPYTNPDGVSRPACAFCGYCERMGCMVAAKSQPSNTLMPLLENHKSVSIRTGASVRRIVRGTPQGVGKARGVTYVDDSGEEFFQPADLVILASWTLNNTRLLLLSGVGEPYDPATGKGALGKNLTHQISFAAARVFLEKPLNRFMGAGGTGIRIADFDADVLDHSNLPFLRGGTMAAMSVGTQPIDTFGVLPRSFKPRWGSEWKKAAVSYYDRWGSIAFSGEELPYKGNFMDLDPTYKDHLGDPLLRITIDWRDNERKMVEFAIGKAVDLGRAIDGAKDVDASPGYGHYDATRYQSTHIQGGTIMATSPDRGVVNPHLQHWQLSNLFILGASTFPNQGSANPTPTILALAYRAADTLVDRYLKNPGALA